MAQHLKIVSLIRPGPYVYSLYKDQFGLKETIVAALFTTGFLSGAVSGYFVGQWADKFGRKAACMVFCVTYSIACFSTLAPNVPLLFVGRTFGGISTSLMYSAFESWMVTEYHKRQMDNAGMSLSNMYGTMTTLNSIVAIIAGVSSEYLVQFTHTKRAPFMASAALLSIAFWIILGCWVNILAFSQLQYISLENVLTVFQTENHGDSHKTSDTATTSTPAKNALKIFFTDKRILTLGLASCFFEGSMYLFVFFWSPALKSASKNDNLPFGMIFACFMSAVTLGSLIFNALTSSRIISHSRLLTIIFATASSSLLVPIITKNPHLTFWSFCIFEGCVGMYWPSVGYLKGRFIEDGIRARIYGMLRIPLNMFVVVALSLVREGEEYRNLVFMVCSGLLVVTSGIFHHFVREQ